MKFNIVQKYDKYTKTGYLELKSEDRTTVRGTALRFEEILDGDIKGLQTMLPNISLELLDSDWVNLGLGDVVAIKSYAGIGLSSKQLEGNPFYPLPEALVFDSGPYGQPHWDEESRCYKTKNKRFFGALFPSLEIDTETFIPTIDIAYNFFIGPYKCSFSEIGKLIELQEPLKSKIREAEKVISSCLNKKEPFLKGLVPYLGSDNTVEILAFPLPGTSLDCGWRRSRSPKRSLGELLKYQDPEGNGVIIYGARFRFRREYNDYPFSFSKDASKVIGGYLGVLRTYEWKSQMQVLGDCIRDMGKIFPQWGEENEK